MNKFALVVAAWIFWLWIGFICASAWLAHACPDAACNGILIALQLPQLLIGAVIWFGLGVLGSIAIVAIDPSIASSRSQQLCYADGRSVKLGDVVIFEGSKPLRGKVIQVAGVSIPEAPIDPRLATATNGFVIKTEDHDLHQFLATHLAVKLVSRQEALD
jgi:hypothetical protein